MHWNEQHSLRKAVEEKFPDLWHLPVVRKRLPFLLKYLRDGESILEVGAYERKLEGRIRENRPHSTYRTLDIDPTYPQDYSSFQEVQETFDVVLLYEVLEHLLLDEAREMASNIHKVLNPGGRIILTVPNVYTPGQQWTSLSHFTAYHFQELGGLFLNQKFEILDICRLYHAKRWRFFTRVYLFSLLFRFLGIDFTRSIMLVGRKV